MEVFDNYIYFGGGGGIEQKEIPNLIEGYRLPPAGEKFIKDKPIYEKTTEVGVANYMTIAKDVSHSTSPV